MHTALYNIETGRFKRRSYTAAPTMALSSFRGLFLSALRRAAHGRRALIAAHRHEAEAEVRLGALRSRRQPQFGRERVRFLRHRLHLRHGRLFWFEAEG